MPSNRSGTLTDCAELDVPFPHLLKLLNILAETKQFGIAGAKHRETHLGLVLSDKSFALARASLLHVEGLRPKFRLADRASAFF